MNPVEESEALSRQAPTATRPQPKGAGVPGAAGASGPPAPRLTFIGHLEELRRRLGISLAALLVASGLALTQIERLIGWLQHPVRFLLPRFAYFTPTEPLTAYLRVAVLAGVVLAMPVILQQLWAFLRSGLTPRERTYGLLFVWWGSAQFVLGALFAYVVLLPAALRFLLGIGERYLIPVVSIDRYVAFVTTLLFSCGLVFELPVVLCLLARLGVVTSEWLRQHRPYAVLVLVIIAALVTPTTDPVNLLLVAVPMLLLYEGSVVLARWMAPAPRASQEM